MQTLLFHVNSFLTGGIEKILLEILKGLDPKRYRIKLSIAFNMGEQELLKPQIPSYVEVNYLLEHYILTTPHKNKKTGQTNTLEKALSEMVLPSVQKIVKRNKLKKILHDVDVVIDFDTTLAPLYKLFAHKKSIAYCHFGFDNIWKGKRRKLDKLAMRLSHYDKLVMLCDEMKEDAAKMYPVLMPKLVRIYNALDLETIRDLSNESVEIPDEFLKHGYFISVGRLHEAQKDFTTLLKAYKTARARYGVKEHLIIVGKGGDKIALETLAKDLEIAEKVLFTGLQKNPYKWMHNAKLFLFSSKYEGLPTVLIEAHALGLPIVATKTPTGVTELLMNGKTGTLVAVGDEDEMAIAIKELSADPALQQQYKIKAAELLKQFEIGYMVPKLEELF